MPELDEPREITPQPRQRVFLACNADIAIYGGAAGGGKSYGLLLDDLYGIGNPSYSSICFRREYPQIMASGGLWDTATKIYPHVGGKPNEGKHEWKFPCPQCQGDKSSLCELCNGNGGAVVRFAHLQLENDKLNWQGAQVPRIRFDELDQFTESQFWYLFSRNRSPHGIRSYIRATTNANNSSWVAKFISWWWDPDTGFAIPSRAGKVRWFVRDPKTGDISWASDPKELSWGSVEVDGQMLEQSPKSVTFIPAKVTDNKKLLESDPGYLSTLLSLPPVERAQLLEGNWLITPAPGLYFKRAWFPIVQAPPAQATRCRRWDFAATEPRSKPLAGVSRQDSYTDPDWTAGCRIARTPEGRLYIEDIVHFRGTPDEVKAVVRQTAVLDGRGVTQVLEQEPGSAGKFAVKDMRALLDGYETRVERPTGPKGERIKPLSSQAEAGNVWLIEGEWNNAFIAEAEQFPTGKHDDMLDSAAGAHEFLAGLVRPDGVKPGIIPKGAIRVEGGDPEAIEKGKGKGAVMLMQGTYRG